MNGKNVVNLGDPSRATDASNKNNFNTITNNILSGSETFQGDINMNNNRIRNLYTARQHAEKSDDSQSLRVVSSNRWDADGKTIYDLSRAQYDDEAVA